MSTWFHCKDPFSYGNQLMAVPRSNFALCLISFTGLLGIYSPEQDKENSFFKVLYPLVPMQNTYFTRGGWAEVKLVLKITVDSSVLAFVLYLVTVTKSEEGMFKQHT